MKKYPRFFLMFLWNDTSMIFHELYKCLFFPFFNVLFLNCEKIGIATRWMRIQNFFLSCWWYLDQLLNLVFVRIIHSLKYRCTDISFKVKIIWKIVYLTIFLVANATLENSQSVNLSLLSNVILLNIFPFRQV